MNRWPTVPVAPRTATLRLRIAIKSDASRREPDKVDDERGRHPRDPAHDGAGFVEHAVAVGDRGDGVGHDRAHEVPVLVEEEIAWRVAAPVQIADRPPRRRRELHPDEAALAAEARRRDLDGLAVGHADEAEVRIELDDDRLSRL